MKFLSQYLLHAVGAQEYDMEVSFADKESDTLDLRNDLMADITVEDVYLFCRVRVNKFLLSRWTAGDHEYVAGCLCHEMCHILTHPLAKIALDDAAPSQTQPFRDVVERQTERISKALMHALPTNFWTMEHLEKWGS